jgi:CheY-like chemotaxis protein
MSCEFGEVLARVARGLERRAHQHSLHFGFDSRGPPLLLDTDSVPLECCLNRLALGVQDLILRGAMMLDGRVRRSRSGQGIVTIRLWATGVLDDEPATEAVLRRLSLHEAVDTGPGSLDMQPKLRRLEGECPCTGAHVRLARSPAQGVVAIAERRFDVDAHGPTGSGEEPHAGDAQAWVIGADPVSAEALVQRLKRLGWAPQRFERPTDAIRRLRMRGPGGSGATPALALVLDARGDAGGETRAALHRLGELLPVAARKLLAVVLGSHLLSGGPRGDGFEVIPLPVAATVLRHVTEAILQVPLPLTSPPVRRAMLVVDDEPINRTLAVQMLRRLGESAEEAGNGLEAIAHCRIGHPSLVLMDVDMPHMDGLQATRQLRALQALGQVSPCPILAATASLDPSRLGSCIGSGMDEAMLKPLSCSMLQDRLARWVC